MTVGVQTGTADMLGLTVCLSGFTTGPGLLLARVTGTIVSGTGAIVSGLLVTLCHCATFLHFC